MRVQMGSGSLVGVGVCVYASVCVLYFILVPAEVCTSSRKTSEVQVITSCLTGSEEGGGRRGVKVRRCGCMTLERCLESRVKRNDGDFPVLSFLHFDY